MSNDPLRFLAGYPLPVQTRARELIEAGQAQTHLHARYPQTHEVRNNAALVDYVQGLKRTYLKQSPPLAKVCFSDKLSALHRALGTHSFVSRVQGAKLKAKNELRVASLFKRTPEAFLRMVVVHELAHLREKEHNRAFYRLCVHMEPQYHQYEFDLRLFLSLESAEALTRLMKAD